MSNSKSPPPNSVECRTRAEWRAWLTANHASGTGVWLVYFKKDSGETQLPYAEQVEEALCFGWVDSKPNKLDDKRTMLYFAPRKAGSGWARTNKVSAGQGPETSIPSATPAATAGAMIRCSSSPNNPPSLPCGFSAATPMRGLRPKSLGNKSSSKRTFSSTAEVVNPANTSRKAMCNVT